MAKITIADIKNLIPNKLEATLEGLDETYILPIISLKPNNSDYSIKLTVMLKNLKDFERIMWGVYPNNYRELTLTVRETREDILLKEISNKVCISSCSVQLNSSTDTNIEAELVFSAFVDHNFLPFFLLENK